MSAAAKFSFLAGSSLSLDGFLPGARGRRPSHGALEQGGEGTSGITENGVICKTEEGLPQGGGRPFTLASLLLE